MAHKHYTLIARRDISTSDRFVLCISRPQNSASMLFFAGHRTPGTRDYSVHVYSALGLLLNSFSMTRTHGRFYIRNFKDLRRCRCGLVAKFYSELTRYRANDLCFALCIDASRSYTTVNEAARCIATNLEVPASHFNGLYSAVVFAASDVMH